MQEVENLIVELGKKKVWQNPNKDKQSIIKLARLTRKNGWIRHGKVIYENIETPTEKGYYHVYQLGDNYPGEFNLIARKHQWYRLSEWSEVIKATMFLYNAKGRMIPLNDVYTMRMYNDNILIAILINENYGVDLNKDAVYFHVYQNHYHRKSKPGDVVKPIVDMGNTQSNQSTNNSIFTIYKQYHVSNPDKTILFKNGFFVEDIDLRVPWSRDETLAFHYDSSILFKHDIALSDLRTYKSELDSKTKYLFHIPKVYADRIHYRDDIDFFVYRLNADGSKTGLYYHKNMEDSIRMVTHADYGLPVPYVMSIIESLDEHPDLSNYYIRVYVRDNLNHQPLIDDVNMVTSLYILPDDKIVEALVKVDSTVPEWQANHLEQSPYTALMRSQRHEITPHLVLDAFGYSTAISSIANPNILITVTEKDRYFELPEGLQEDSTIFEYNNKGLLLGWYTNESVQEKYYPYNQDCIYIEALSGIGKQDIDIHDALSYTIEKGHAYRIYKATTEGSKIISEWSDATGDKRVMLDGLNLTFNYNQPGETARILSDKNFLCYDFESDLSDGILDFSISRMNERYEVLDLEFPLGKLDIWLNGHSLVEDIDYYVDFPNVAIITKKHLIKDNNKQKVTVRFSGFPFMKDGVLKRVKAREIGFVKYGRISVDNHYDIHHDKVLRVTLDGGVYHPLIMKFDEDGYSPVGSFIEEGQPYSVETPYIPLKGSLSVNLYQAQDRDYGLTERVSDYITANMDVKPKETLPPVLNHKYQVYSTLISKLAHDLRYGKLQSVLDNVPDSTVDKILKPYQRYMTLDPCFRGYDNEFVIVHAHPYDYYMELTPRDISFLERINKKYLNNHVDISNFIRVRNKV